MDVSRPFVGWNTRGICRSGRLPSTSTAMSTMMRRNGSFRAVNTSMAPLKGRCKRVSKRIHPEQSVTVDQVIGVWREEKKGHDMARRTKKPLPRDPYWEVVQSLMQDI